MWKTMLAIILLLTVSGAVRFPPEDPKSNPAGSPLSVNTVKDDLDSRHSISETELLAKSYNLNNQQISVTVPTQFQALVEPLHSEGALGESLHSGVAHGESLHSEGALGESLHSGVAHGESLHSEGALGESLHSGVAHGESLHSEGALGKSLPPGGKPPLNPSVLQANNNHQKIEDKRYRRQTYDASYLQSIGYDPLMAWGKRFDDSYLASVGYDPSMDWAKKKRFDENYFQSVGYDPSMAWDQHYVDPYLQAIGYDPIMGWGRKRYDDDSFQHAIGHDPHMAWRKRWDDSYLQSIGYDPAMAWGGHKRFDDDAYMQSIGYDPAIWWKKKRGYTDALLPKYTLEGMKKSVKHGDLDHAGSTKLNKRSIKPSFYFGIDDYSYKRSPSEMGPRGFDEGIFNDNFGFFSTVKRSKRGVVAGSSESSPEQLTSETKRSFGMGSKGFHDDTFSEGFGGFSTLRKRRPEMDSHGFYGDVFTEGFGDFGTMKKRYNEMTSSGFHGDTFSGGFGSFGTMKKRRPEMTANGLADDMFTLGSGDTMKKLRKQDIAARIMNGLKVIKDQNYNGLMPKVKTSENSKDFSVEENATTRSYESQDTLTLPYESSEYRSDKESRSKRYINDDNAHEIDTEEQSSEHDLLP